MPPTNPPAGVASFHLIRARPGRALRAMARLATDRPRLARTHGLEFWRVLGTGRGDDTGTGVDLQRTALFAVWRGEDELEQFLATSPIARRWDDAHEAWHVRLDAISGHGSWRGHDVLAHVRPATTTGPVAVLTRADVRLGAWRAFARAGRPVSDEVRSASGLVAVLGMGEAPVGRLGTFSVWRSADDVDEFVRSMHAHRDTVRRTRTERWYREELFARFAPYASSGAWDGRDPLAV